MTSKEYYQIHKEEILARCKDRIQNMSPEEREQMKEYYKEYYKNNKDYYKKRKEKWLDEKRERWNAYQNWYKTKRYWKDRLAKDPDNEEIKQKLMEIENNKISTKKK